MFLVYVTISNDLCNDSHYSQIVVHDVVYRCFSIANNNRVQFTCPNVQMSMLHIVYITMLHFQLKIEFVIECPYI